MTTQCCGANFIGETTSPDADGYVVGLCADCKDWTTNDPSDDEHYMSWQSLSTGRARFRTADKFEAFMSGAAEARQDNKGNVRLLYTDGTDEIAPCPELDIIDKSISWFGLVMRVQSKRSEERTDV